MTFPVTDEPTLELWCCILKHRHHPNHPEKLFRLKDLMTMTYSLFYASKHSAFIRRWKICL